MLAFFPWMPSAYYLKNSLQPDFKKGMDSACRRVKGKLFHKTTPLSTKTIFKIIGTEERDFKFIRGIS